MENSTVLQQRIRHNALITVTKPKSDDEVFQSIKLLFRFDHSKRPTFSSKIPLLERKKKMLFVFFFSFLHLNFKFAKLIWMKTGHNIIVMRLR